MKLTTRGFTLVELMIVIAIIGILAAALFPSLTNYLKRSRDAARAAGLKDISTAVGAFYSDRDKYPDTGTGCMSAAALSTAYMEAGVPVDPSSTNGNGCPNNGLYGYGSGTSNASSPQFILTAVFENINGWNFVGSWVSFSGGYNTWGAFNGTVRALLDAANAVKRGNGPGYVLYK